MKKRISETFTIILFILLIFILATIVINLFIHDWSDSAFLSMVLCGIGFCLNQKVVKQNKKDFEQQCDLQYNAILTYIVACMQTSSWAPSITTPADIASIATPYFPVYATRCFTTTLVMRSVNRAPLTSAQLTQVRQILNTDFQTAIQNGYIQCRNIKVGFPINNNNEVHVVIEVFV